MRHFNKAEKPPSMSRFSTSRSPPPPFHNAQDEDGEAEEEEQEEEDDYMNMTFDEAPAAPETSLQRRERLKKEGLKRGRVPSKAELAAQERERREEGLSRSLIPDHLPSSSSRAVAAAAAAAATTTTTSRKSKGLAMMAKMGFRPGATLGAGGGSSNDARVEPLRIEVREDRGGIGLEGERKRKLREAAAARGVDVDVDVDDDDDDEAGAKRPRVVVDEGDYRERMARERDAARKEKLVRAAQGIAERMDEDREAADVAVGRAGAGGGVGDDDDDDEDKRERPAAKKARRTTTTTTTTTSPRPLKSVPVLYRVLVRRREETERDRRMRHDLEVSAGTLSAKLPTYDEDEGMDADDKLAVGREVDKKTVYVVADDLDEEDPELAAFEALAVEERLKRLVEYLREQYRYCFWCKFAYPDEEMEGCPGTTEEDHD